jgi:hypothetical protein
MKLELLCHQRLRKQKGMALDINGRTPYVAGGTELD